jgi:flap endonuclease-1
LGCDYGHTIKGDELVYINDREGLGPVHALEFMQKYGRIEDIIAGLDPQKYDIPPNFDPATIRQLFKRPNIIPPNDIKVRLYILYNVM